MAKNKTWKLLGHLVDISIPKWNFLVTILAWKFARCCKNPSTPFLQTRWNWWTPTERKVAWTSKESRNPRFFPLEPPTMEVSTVLFNTAKVRSSQTFLCRMFVSNVFGLGSVAYWMDAKRFSGLREKRFFLGNEITITSLAGATYLKMSRHVLRIQWYFRWLSSSFRSDVMVTHKFTGH